jgi:TPR repeat protein
MQSLVHFLKCLGISLLMCSLFACNTAMKTNSELQQGQRYFEAGYYKRALHQLLPLAIDNNPEAQYAIGYLYYYGYGVTQDLEVGLFWIERAAKQGYQPATTALKMIKQKQPPK